jgi:Integrase core domain
LPAEIVSIDSIAIPQQIFRRSVKWKRLNDLLGGPFCGRVSRHIEMHNASAIVCKHDEDEEDFKPDGVYCEEVDTPRQRAYVERIIGSIRRECLDHMVIFNEDSLRRTLRSYFRYYHRSRLHLSLDKDSQDSRPVQPLGKIVAVPEVGGLHHRYDRQVA